MAMADRIAEAGGAPRIVGAGAKRPAPGWPQNPDGRRAVAERVLFAPTYRTRVRGYSEPNLAAALRGWVARSLCASVSPGEDARARGQLQVALDPAEANA